MQECPDLYACKEGPHTSQSWWQWTTLRAASTIDSILGRTRTIPSVLIASGLSLSGLSDGRQTGYLASHISGGTVPWLDSRLTDVKTRWRASVTDLRPLIAPHADNPTCADCSRYIALGPE